MLRHHGLSLLQLRKEILLLLLLFFFHPFTFSLSEIHLPFSTELSFAPWFNLTVSFSFITPFTFIDKRILSGFILVIVFSTMCYMPLSVPILLVFVAFVLVLRYSARLGFVLMASAHNSLQSSVSLDLVIVCKLQQHWLPPPCFFIFHSDVIILTLNVSLGSSQCAYSLHFYTQDPGTPGILDKVVCKLILCNAFLPRVLPFFLVLSFLHYQSTSYLNSFPSMSSCLFFCLLKLNIPSLTTTTTKRRRFFKKCRRKHTKMHPLVESQEEREKECEGIFFFWGEGRSHWAWSPREQHRRVDWEQVEFVALPGRREAGPS